MSCVQYNLVKEGNLFVKQDDNTVKVLEDSAIRSLYDGQYHKTAVTISGTERLYLRAEFGEAYDLCHVDYFTDDTDLSHIEVYYGTNSGTETLASLSQEGQGHVRASVNTFARFVEVKHIADGNTIDVLQLDVIGEKHEVVGFGDSKAAEEDHVYVKNTPIGHTSSSSQEVILFNNSPSPLEAKVAIAPTLSGVDDYIKLSTSSSGTFYGINEYGLVYPGPNPLSLEDDSFSSGSISDQWELIAATPPRQVTPTASGLVFESSQDNLSEGNLNEEVFGLLSKEYFSAQSFTIEVDIKFLDFDPGPDQAVNTTQREWFLALTNSYPIPDIGYHESFLSDARRGLSIAALSLANFPLRVPEVDKLEYSLRVLDGVGSNNPFTAGAETFWRLPHTFSTTTRSIDLGRVSLSEMKEIFTGGKFDNDFNLNAEWHNWKLTYDHDNGQVEVFVDRIKIASYTFQNTSFSEGCKVFLGFAGDGGNKFALKNLKVNKNTLYRQRNVAVSPAVASAAYNDEIADLAIDGDDNTRYYSTTSSGNVRFKVDFPNGKDIVSYRFRQMHEGDSFLAGGTEYYPDIARKALVDIGGKETLLHSYPADDGSTSSEVPYVIRSTGIGSDTIASGVDYLELNFSVFDETSEPNGTFVLSDLQVDEEYYESVSTSSGSGDFPWHQGRWHNLKQQKGDENLVLRDALWDLNTYDAFPEYLVEGVDYGFSSAIFPGSTSEDYHGAESLFVPDVSYNGLPIKWESDLQADNHFYVWRRFREFTKVKGVYWRCGTTGINTEYQADQFKFQYLKLYGDPNNENDWVDIPPVQQAHPYTSTDIDQDYKTYRDYLIANNDGEYYTNYKDIPIVNSFSFSIGPNNQPQGVEISRANKTINQSYIGYVQFDEPVDTRAIRFVVYSPYVNDTSSLQFGLRDFEVFSWTSAGSFETGVIDTGTRQNTERVHVKAQTPTGTTVRVFARSGDTPPEQVLDNKFEVWEFLGKPGSPEFGEVGDQNRYQALTLENDRVLYFSQQGPKVFHPTLTNWTDFPDLPSQQTFSTLGVSTSDSSGGSSSGPELVVDTNVKNNVGLLGDDLYLAVLDDSSNLKTRYIATTPKDGTGIWRLLPGQRPQFTHDATMATYNDKVYFFAKDGSISWYDPGRDLWKLLGTDLAGGSSERDKLAAVTYGSKIYLFGGENSGTSLTSATAFDPSTEKLTVLTSAPKPMEDYEAIVVPSRDSIYLLPLDSLHSSVLRYSVSKDTWYIVPSLSWSRAASGPEPFSASVYFYHGGHIYVISSVGEMYRTKVVPGVWDSGGVPNVRDPVWSQAGNLPWEEIGNDSELMVQKRYIQVKVELLSEDKQSTPTLEGVSVVTPQSVTIPASGTSSVYLKTDLPSVNPNDYFHYGKLKVHE